ncbi:hypothetical protein RhiirC2_764214 [Rhizophagus irregularis]|uniref:Uncharacterized protein n=1 Tax=Rhizophagus irregularis TaxID=588596 RepID=A0A2N1M5C6_9GLOM|nr:hypothetical protein RhiirC2_764214 [Rhizophagus irregularis]
MKMFNNEIKAAADTTTSNIPMSGRMSHHAYPHHTSRLHNLETCIYCNGFRWVAAYCDKILSEFKGHYWSSKSYQAKNCKFNARKEPWL